MWFNTIKRFYDSGHPSYTNENLKVFVVAKMITEDEYEVISGEPYVV